MHRNVPSHDVIICVHDGLEDVKKCLESLARWWKPEGLRKLIIVNDCSGLETTKTISDFINENDYAEVLHFKERQYYTRAANSGLRHSNAKIRTLLNSDTIVTSEWATSIRKIFEVHEYVGVVGPLSNAASTQSVPSIENTSKSQTAINELPSGVTLQDFADFCKETAKNLHLPVPFVPLIHGFCYSVSAELVETIGYFDTNNFPCGYGEENDYSFRAEEAGFALAVALESFVFHAKSKSYTNSDREQFSNAGMKALAAKYSVRRITNSIEFMKKNPMLVAMREAIANQWPSQ